MFYYMKLHEVRSMSGLKFSNLANIWSDIYRDDKRCLFHYNGNYTSLHVKMTIIIFLRQDCDYLNRVVLAFSS